MSDYINEPMLEMFIYETSQLIGQLEQLIINYEKQGTYDTEVINEVFRIMHTIKGSSSMMLFDGISKLTHSAEDVFFYIREESPVNIEYSILSDLVLDLIDFIKVELEKIRNGASTNEEPVRLIDGLDSFLSELKETKSSTSSLNKKFDTCLNNQDYNKQYYIAQNKVEHYLKSSAYKAILLFEDDCGMENLRAFTVIHNLNDVSKEYFYQPAHLMEDENSSHVIKSTGFHIFFRSCQTYNELLEHFQQTTLLKSVDLVEITEFEYMDFVKPLNNKAFDEQVEMSKLDILGQTNRQTTTTNQGIVSVSVSKLDKLMDLVGELVISEAMVTENSEIRGLELENFHKAARQLRKITHELQDTVMSIRMVPLAATFLKMHRVVRDMSKKQGKEVELNVIGEGTEVDKNIIEHISDPLMHLVRNAIDHGIESIEERQKINKPQTAILTLEAKSVGNDVLIIVRDDGKGLNRDKILDKARKNNLLSKSVNDMTDNEVFNLILVPGFSTKENITEYSGRGVGMDVVVKNIQSVGGSISIDSEAGHGTSITLKIPLTLAIMGGMTIRVGSSYYTIPMLSVKESFKPETNRIITNQDGDDMIMIRGQCYPILPLYKKFKVRSAETQYVEGIFIMVEDSKTYCIFADELVGEQQVVVKALPSYIMNISKYEGLAGCTLLGDGSISLILDIENLY